MDFNTGRESEGPQRPPSESGSGSSGGYGGGPGGPPPRVAASSSGGDFNISDPVNSFLDITRRVLTGPADFFRGVARRGNFVNPLIFALICAVIYGVVNGLFTMLGNIIAGTSGVGGAIVGFFFAIILVPIYTAASLFIGAAIYFLLVMLLAGQSNAGYEATFRVGAYSSVILVPLAVVSIFNVLPIVGPIISGLLSLVIGVYGVVIQVLGIREVHSTTTGRAVAIVLIPTAVILLIVLLIVGAALLAIFAGTRGQF